MMIRKSTKILDIQILEDGFSRLTVDENCDPSEGNWGYFLPGDFVEINGNIYQIVGSKCQKISGKQSITIFTGYYKANQLNKWDVVNHIDLQFNNDQKA